MSLNTYKRMVQGYTPKLDTIDEMLEGTPLFQTSIWGPTNNGFSHKYNELKDIVAAEAVNLNSAYPTVGADFNLENRDIAFFAGRREVHVNTVEEMAGGNLNTYLKDEMPAVYNQTLMNVSFDTYYNVLRPFAKAKGKLVSATATPSGNKYSSIYFVRWQKGQMQGLVNDNWAKAKGGVFKAIPLSGGDRYVNPVNGKSVYGVDIEMPLGFLPANGKNVSGIVNIDLATITNDDLGQLVTNALVQARPGLGGKLVAYANPILVARLGQINQAQAKDGVSDNNVYSVLWNGVEIIGDWNLLEGTEAPYTI